MPPRLSPSSKFARRIFLFLAVALLVGGAIAWFVNRTGPPRFHAPSMGALELVEVSIRDRPLMGTTVNIITWAPEEVIGRQAIEAALRRGDEINAICTDYNPESELMRLARAPLNEPIPVSQTLATVLAHARSTAELTEGAYDPTFGPLTKLWRKSRRQKKLPAAELLAKARQAAHWKNLEVDLAQQFVVLKEEGMQLDLGGIAKGFAADEMLRILASHGVQIASIAIGGDVRLGAPPPGQAAWRVGIKTLGPELTQFIEVANCAVSTSGDLYQTVEIDGTRYSHIIDPDTGLGLTRRIAATVVAPTAVQSDPLATFCCIQPEQALQLFLGGEISCRIVTLANGRPIDRTTPQFPQVDSL